MNKYTTNKRYILGTILTILFFAGVSYFFEGRANFGVNDSPFFTNYEFLFSFIALFILEISILVVAKRSFQIKFNLGLALTLLIFFAASILSIAFYSGVSYNSEIIGQVSSTYKIRYVLLAFILYLSMYEIISIIPSFLSGRRMIRIIFIIAVITGFVASIYSFAQEKDFYVSFFQGTLDFDSYTMPQSYTSNKNVYALVLFFALTGEAFLEIERPHWWRWIIMLYFFIQQFFAMSKTCLFMASLFFLCFAIFSFIRGLKNKSPSRSAYILIFLMGVVALGCVLFFNGSDTGFLGSTAKFGAYLSKELFALSKNSLQARIQSVEIPFAAVKGDVRTLLFGFGYGNEYRALGCFSFGDPNVYSIIDNAWGLTLAQGGVFGIAYSIVIWGFGFIVIGKALFKKSRYALFSLFIYICLFGRTMTENDNISYLDFAGVCYFAFSLLPVLVEKAQTAKEKTIQEVLVKERPSTISSYLGKAFAITLLPSLFLIALSRKIGYMQNIPYLTSLLLRYGGIILFFVSPIVLGAMLYALNQKKKAVGVLSLIVYLIYVASIFVLPLFSQSRLLLLPQLGILALDIFVLSMAGIFERKYFSIRAIFVNYIIFSAICGITYLMFRNFARSVTFFSLFAILAVYISIWIYLYFIPRKMSLITPFECAMETNENKYLIYRKKKELKFENKTQRIVYDHPIR